MLGYSNVCLGTASGQASGDLNTYNSSTALGTFSIITSSNQIMLGSIAESVVCPNALSVAGIFSAIQTIDPMITVLFTSTPSFNMVSGMVINLATTSTAISSLGFTNIPITPQTTSIFTFILKPSTASSAYYLKPPTNFISITPIGGVINTSVPLYGISNVSLPVSYTYLLQNVTIVNTSTTTTPNYIAFTGVTGY
jgi:hypothetical protein